MKTKHILQIILNFSVLFLLYAYKTYCFQKPSSRLAGKNFTIIQIFIYMAEKTYHLAPYLGAFGAYLMPQRPIQVSKGGSIYQSNLWNVAVNSQYLPSGQKAISFGQKRPRKTKFHHNSNLDLYGCENLSSSTIFRPFWVLFNASGTHIGFERCSHLPK